MGTRSSHRHETGIEGQDFGRREVPLKTISAMRSGDFSDGKGESSMGMPGYFRGGLHPERSSDLQSYSVWEAMLQVQPWSPAFLLGIKRGIPEQNVVPPNDHRFSGI